jgi:microcystin-dependent protein
MSNSTYFPEDLFALILAPYFNKNPLKKTFMDEYLGIIKLFGGNFAPRGWMMCNGQVLSIAQNTALFSLLGTTYGGNGQTTFALPDLRGRTAIGMGQGLGLTPRTEGELSGSENNTLTIPNIPAHNHVGMLNVSNGDSTQNAATAGATISTPGVISGRSFTANAGFNTTAPNTLLNASSVTTSVVGNNAPVNNMQPYLVLNYIICVSGIYPSRN